MRTLAIIIGACLFGSAIGYVEDSSSWWQYGIGTVLILGAATAVARLTTR